MTPEHVVARIRELVRTAGGWPDRLDPIVAGMLVELVRDRYSSSVEERIAALIRAQGGRIEMLHEQIAQAVGAARETVTRALSARRFCWTWTGKTTRDLDPRIVKGQNLRAYALAVDGIEDRRICADCRASGKNTCAECTHTRECLRRYECEERKQQRQALNTDWKNAGEKPCERRSLVPSY